MKLIDVAGSDIEEVKAAIFAQVRSISDYELSPQVQNDLTNDLYAVAETSLRVLGSVQITIGTED